MKLGIENKKEMIAAAVLGVTLLAILAYQFMPSSSTSASTATAAATAAAATTKPSQSTNALHSAAARHGSASASGKASASAPANRDSANKDHAPQNLDPMLHLDQLAATEQIKYQGSGRNIFVAQAEEIPQPIAPGHTDKKNEIYNPPPVAAAPPIPLKFFGFASHPGEPKKIFLVKGDDVFIAGEGEIVDRRYKVVRISTTSVDVQDVVGSGPPQTIPLTQG